MPQPIDLAQKNESLNLNDIKIKDLGLVPVNNPYGYNPIIPGSNDASTSQAASVIRNIQNRTGQENVLSGSFSNLLTQQKDTQSTFGAFFSGALKNTLGLGIKLGQAGSIMTSAIRYVGLNSFKSTVDFFKSGDIEESYNNNFNAENFNKVYNNVLVNTLSEVDEYIKEALPVYADDQYNSYNLIDRMGTAKFWADDMFDGIAFAASAWISGGTLAVVGRGAAKMIAKKLGKEALSRTTTSLLTLVPGIVYNTVTEAGVEAKHSYDDMYDMLIKMGKDEKEAKRLASNGAANVFKSNLGVLLLSNSIEMKMLFGNPVSKHWSEIRRIVNSGQRVEDVSVMKNMLKSALVAIPSESLWEENMQLAISNYEKYSAAGLYDPELLNSTSGVLNEWVRNFSTIEGANSMTIGGIIGGGMGAFGGYRDAKNEKEKINQAWKIKDEIDKILDITDKSFIDYTKQRFTTNPDGTLTLDPNGEVVLNSDFITSRAKQLGLDDEYTIQSFLNILNKDDVALSYTDSMYLTRKLFSYLSNPLYENTDEAFKTMLTRLEGEIEILAKGDKTIKKDEALSKYLTSIKPKLETIKKQYDNNVKKIKGITSNNPVEDLQINESLKRILFYNISKIESLKEIEKDPNTSDVLKDQIKTIIETTENYNNNILNNKEERQKYIDRIKERKTQQQNSLTEIENLQKIVADKNSSIDQIEEANKKINNLELDKDLDLYTNGFSEFERLGTSAVEKLGTNDFWTVIGKKKSYDYYVGKDIAIKQNYLDNLEELHTKLVEFINEPLEGTTPQELEQSKDQKLQSLFREYKGFINVISELTRKLKNDPSVNLTDQDMLLLTSSINKITNELSSAINDILPDYTEYLAVYENEFYDALDNEENGEIDFLNEYLDVSNYDYNLSLEENLANNPEFRIAFLEIINKDKTYFDNILNKAENGPITIAEANLLNSVLFQRLEDEMDTIDSEFLNLPKYTNKFLENFLKMNEEEKNNFLFEDYIKTREIEGGLGYNSIKSNMIYLETILNNNIESELDKINDPSYFSSLSKRLSDIINYLESKESLPKNVQDLLNEAKKFKEKIENELIPLAIKNSSKRTALQIQAFNNDVQNAFTSIGLFIENDGTMIKLPIFTTIENIIGNKLMSEFLNKIQEEFKANKYFDKTRVEQILSVLRSKTKDELKPLEEEIKKIKDTILTEFDNYKQKDPLFNKINVFVSAYLENPNTFIVDMVKYLSVNDPNINPNYYSSPAYSFTKHKQIQKLITDIEAKKESDGKKDYNLLLDFLVLHSSYTNILNLENSLNLKNNKTFLEFNTNLNKLNETEKYSLNYEQLNAVNQMFNWLNNNDVTWGYLQGIAGTGKSTVVIPYLLKLSNYNMDNVIAVAHNSSASKTINSAINKSSEDTISHILTNPDLLKDKTLLIIDEIEANDKIVYENLAKLIIKINEQRKIDKKPLLKVLTLGDPNQLKKVYDIHNFLLKMYLDKTQLELFNPLTIAYRSDVGSINSLSLAFQDTVMEIKNLVLKASSVITDENNIGAFTMKLDRTNGLLNDIVTRLNTMQSNSKTRVIIVGNDNDLKAYKDYLNSINDKVTEVLHYVDAQGRTFDEAYIDLNKTEVLKQSNRGSDSLKENFFNTVMYTSITRAMNFVMLTDSTNTFTNEKETASTTELKQTLEKEKKELKETIKTITQNRINAYSSMPTGVQPITNPPPTNPPPANPPPANNPITPAQPPLTNPPPIPEDLDLGLDPVIDTTLPDSNIVSTTEDEEFIADDREDVVVVDDLDKIEQLTNDSESVVDNNKGEEKVNDENTHIISAPNEKIITKSFHKENDPERQIDKNTVEPKATLGTKVVYIKVSDPKKGVVIKVFSKRESFNGENNDLYDLVTIILPTNINENNSPANKKLQELFNENKNVVDLGDKTVLNEQEINDSKDSILLQGNISFVRELSFSYNTETTYQGEGLSKYLITQLLPLIMNKDSTEQLYGTIGTPVYKIFTQKEIYVMRDSKNLALSPNDAGFPYAVIPVKIDGSKKIKKYYIRLNPRHIKQTDTFVQDLVKFHKAITKIEDEISMALSTKDHPFKWNNDIFNLLVNIYKNNYKAEIDQVNFDSKTQKTTKTFKIVNLGDQVSIDTIKEKLHLWLENNYLTEDQVSVIHKIFLDNIEDIVNTAFKPTETSKKTTITGYTKFLQDNAENLDENDLNEFLKWHDLLKKASEENGTFSFHMTIDDGVTNSREEVPFTSSELKIILNKTQLASHLLIREYNNHKIDFNSLPVSDKETPGFRGRTFFEYIDKNGDKQRINYTQYRIRKLRRMTSSKSYIKITKGEHVGKYYALDPLKGEILIVDKKLPFGFVSDSVAEKEGVSKQVIKTLTLSKNQSPASKALYLIARANKQVNGKDIRLPSFTNKKFSYFVPSLLSYITEEESTVNTALLGMLRKSFNLWYKKTYSKGRTEQNYNNRTNLFDYMLQYTHPETGEVIDMQVKDYDGLRDPKSVGLLKKNIKLEDEHNLQVLLDFLIDNQIKTPEGITITQDYVNELFGKETNKEKLNSNDLESLFNNSESQTTNIRRPISKTYLDRAQIQLEFGNLSTEEKNQLQSDIENLFVTKFSHVNNTQIHVKFDNNKEDNFTNLPSENNSSNLDNDFDIDFLNQRFNASDDLLPEECDD